MKPAAEPPPTDHSPRDWRTVLGDAPKGPAEPQPAARHYRQARFGRVWGVVGLLVVLAGGVAALALLARRHYEAVAAAGQEAPVRLTHFGTDGVLTREWVEATLGLHQGRTFGSLEAASATRALLAFPQVRSAEVTLRLPDELRVSLTERLPVARLRTRDAAGELVDLVAAADGQLWPGVGYLAAQLRTLPWLAGAAIRPDGDGGFAPLADLPRAAGLLASARRRHPSLYAGWTTVDLTRLHLPEGNPTAAVVVRTRDGQTHTFAPGNYDAQLDTLAEVVRAARARSARPLVAVDVSFADRAVARFGEAPPPPAPVRAARR